jgi:hypothetical protein
MNEFFSLRQSANKKFLTPLPITFAPIPQTQIHY